MKLKFFKYSITVFVIAFSFWFYFQFTTYTYKVDRWVQPLEARLALLTSKNCSPVRSWLNSFVDHAVTRQGGYSAQVAFISAQEELQSCEIGYKDKFFGTEVNAAHRYRYASTSKLVTTAVVLDLISQGKIRYNDKLVHFFPELNNFKDERISQITVADLLNHRAGFNRLGAAGDPMFLRRNKPWCPHHLARLESLTLAFNPGEKQGYSNLGYCLLGAVVSRVTGETFRKYVENDLVLSKYDIRFINNYYYDDEVRYDYRYEEWYEDSYLGLFDFDAISSAAGLSGSARALAQLLWDIHHRSPVSPFIGNASAHDCKLQKIIGCLELGVFHYRPDQYGLTLHFHEGYLPGAASVAVIDSFGGVMVLVKSGANQEQESLGDKWIPWIYKQLNLHYTLQGKLPIINEFTSAIKK